MGGRRASRAARGSSTTRASRSRSPTRPPTPPPGACSALEVARLDDAGADPKLVHAKASMAKLFCSEAANRCADRCLQTFGGRGYMRTNVAERFWRELRVDRIWEGTSEIQRIIIARSLERRGVERVAALVPPRGPAGCCPASIAVVGATDRAGSYGGEALLNLRRLGYPGRVYAVNPRREHVHGVACVPASRRPARGARRGRRRDPGRRRARR